MTAGRPRIWTDTEELQKAVDVFFGSDEKKTICGLALALNFCDRSSLYEYRDRNDKFSPIIKRAMLKVENNYEEHLTEHNATGSIFALKNMKWTDDKNLNIGGQEGKPIETIDAKDAKAYYADRIALLKEAEEAGDALSTNE